MESRDWSSDVCSSDLKQSDSARLDLYGIEPILAGPLHPRKTDRCAAQQYGGLQALSGFRVYSVDDHPKVAAIRDFRSDRDQRNGPAILALNAVRIQKVREFLHGPGEAAGRVNSAVQVQSSLLAVRLPRSRSSVLPVCRVAVYHTRVQSTGQGGGLPVARLGSSGPGSGHALATGFKHEEVGRETKLPPVESVSLPVTFANSFKYLLHGLSRLAINGCDDKDCCCGTMSATTTGSKNGQP